MKFNYSIPLFPGSFGGKSLIKSDGRVFTYGLVIAILASVLESVAPMVWWSYLDNLISVYPRYTQWISLWFLYS